MSILFTPIKMAGITLENRILMSAAASWKATEEGDIDFTKPILQLEIAKGGCGLIINGGVGGGASFWTPRKRFPSF